MKSSNIVLKIEKDERKYNESEKEKWSGRPDLNWQPMDFSIDTLLEI